MILCRLLTRAGIALLACALCGAAEIANLQNGFSIRHERREVVGDHTRLYLQAGAGSGYVEVPTSEIVSIETDNAPALAQQPAPPAALSISDQVDSASAAHGIDRDFVESVVRAESGFNPNAISRKGAQGLMQLMPGTAAQLGVQNAFDPNANLQAGTLYLRQLLDQYHGDAVKALAAYNAGPQRVDQYHGIPPYRETYGYVASVIRDYNRKKLAQSRQAARSSSAGKMNRAASTIPLHQQSHEPEATASSESAATRGH